MREISNWIALGGAEHGDEGAFSLGEPTVGSCENGTICERIVPP
jgi:hypothetical protein